jgi:hypothetical protein
MYNLQAEREGFEPPVPLGTTVFKTVVIDHSTISPHKRIEPNGFLMRVQRYNYFSVLPNYAFTFYIKSGALSDISDRK